MIVRFIDRQGRTCQIATPDTSILVYMTAEEKKNLSSATEGQCLMLVDSRLSEEERQKVVEKLNTKADPLTIKH